MFTFITIFFASTLAAILTSFAGAWIDRHFEGQTITNPPRSHCVCGEDLKPYQLIPIVYPLAVGLQAPCCGSKIPLRYPMSELFSAVAVGLGTYMLISGGTAALLGIAAIFFGMFGASMILLAPHQKDK